MISSSQTLADPEYNSYKYGSTASGTSKSDTTTTVMTPNQFKITGTGYGIRLFQNQHSALLSSRSHRNFSDMNMNLNFNHQRIHDIDSRDSLQTTQPVEGAISTRRANDDQSLFLHHFTGRRQAIGDIIRSKESSQFGTQYLQQSVNPRPSLEGQGHLGGFKFADQLPGTGERRASRPGFMSFSTFTNVDSPNSNYCLSSYILSRVSHPVNTVGNRNGIFQPSIDFASNLTNMVSTAASDREYFKPINPSTSSGTNFHVAETVRHPNRLVPDVMTVHEDDPGWDEQFKALVAFYKENGHCKVPARYSSNPKLGRWVMTQRRQFTLMVQGYSSALTIERIQRLESIGFTWSVRPEPKSSWNIKFEELKAYKELFGNCMVPQRYQANPSLGTWVHTQRRQYKLMKEGKKSSMTQEKAEALDSIGFYWTAKNALANTNTASLGRVDTLT